MKEKNNEIEIVELLRKSRKVKNYRYLRVL